MRPNRHKFLLFFCSILLLLPQVCVSYGSPTFQPHGNLNVKIKPYDPQKPDNKSYQAEADHLLSLGFKRLDGRYFLKDKMFLVKLSPNGSLEGIHIPFMSNPKYDLQNLATIEYKESNATFGNKKLLHLIFKDRKFFAQSLSTNMSTQNTFQGTFFTKDEKETGTPLKVRLENIGATELLPHSGVYQLTDEGDSILIYYKNEQILFIGQEIDFLSFNSKTRIKHTILDILLIENKYLRYEIDSKGYIGEGSQKQLSEMPLPLQKNQQYQKEDPSGFKIGGINTNATIRQLETLTNLPINEIEQRAQPGNKRYSNAGFLGHGESFIERLLKDNTFVLDQGYTHQQLAKPLFAIMNLIETFWVTSTSKLEPLQLIYDGKKYEVQIFRSGGDQHSLFQDHLYGSIDFRIKNLDSEKVIRFSELLPYYIHRYGFYEGNTPYRLAPKDIIECFNLKPKNQTDIQLHKNTLSAS